MLEKQYGEKGKEPLVTVTLFDSMLSFVLQPYRTVTQATGGAKCRQGSSGSCDDDAEDDLPKILFHALMVLSWLKNFPAS